MITFIYKLKSNIRRNADIFLSFSVCGLSMYLFCIYSVTRYPRTSTLLTGDVLGQYIPALRSFVKNVWSGNGLSYSWDVFLGMNATEYYGTYVGGSFVNLVYLFFPWLSPEAFIRIAFTLKTAMAGAGFTYFCKKAWNTGNMVPVFISVFYAMCGFQVSSNIVNYIWMDALYMLPIVTANIVVGLKEKRWTPLVLSYAYLFICNFYMGYIVGIFSAIFFIASNCARNTL